jgi:hypothetical protein
MKRDPQKDLEYLNEGKRKYKHLPSYEMAEYWINRATEAEGRLNDYAYVDPDESLVERCQRAFEEQEYLKRLGYNFNNEEFLGGDQR